MPAPVSPSEPLNQADVLARRPEDRLRTTGERGLALLGRQGWLDRPSYRLEHAMSLAIAACEGAGERISNVLHGTSLGHPLHPLLTSLPTGALAATVALDLVDCLPGRRPGVRDAARVTLGVGIAGSLGAAATGLNDWQHTQESSRRVGLVHGVLNATATGLYLLSWSDRGRGRTGRGVAASTLGYGLSLLSGYLGASLVYRWGNGVDQSGVRLTVTDWTPLLAEHELGPDQARHVEVAGIGVVLLRDGDTVLAIGDRCPHLGAPMHDGWIDRGRVVCPWHGSQFQPNTGNVLRGPATAPLPCYETRIREGTIEIRGGKSDAPTAGVIG